MTPEAKGHSLTPSDLWKTWQRTTLGLAKYIGRPLLSHGALALALSGIALYIIGIVRMVGILHAEDVPFSRGLPLVPLQDYFVKGLSVVARPQLWFATVLIALILTVMLALSDLRESEKISPAFDVPLVAPLLFIAALSVVLIPVAEWASLIPGVTITLVCLVKLNREGATSSGVNARQASILAFGVFFGFALSTGARAYFAPPPLDHAVLVNSSGEVREAKLLYQSDNSLYLIGRRDSYTSRRTVELVPISEFSKIVIRDGEVRNSETLPEMLGWPFYRFWEDDNSELHFEPSPPE